MFTIDTSSDFGKRIARQLDDEKVLWLTTVAKSGTPAPKPVWYLWHDGQILVSSQPGTAKVQHVVCARPRVSLNFNATHTGGDVGVLTGDAGHRRQRADSRGARGRTTRSTPTTSPASG